MHRRPSVMIVASVAATGLLASTSVASAQTTRTVCASGCQYTSINAAIDAASNGDVIELSAETYTEGEVIDTDGKAITLLGTTDVGGNPTSILDGNETHRVINCTSGETNQTAFQNLIIQNGADSEYGVGNGGGGIRLLNSTSPTFDNCIIKDNAAVSYAGGLKIRNRCSPVLNNCQFLGNSVSDGFGGGCSIEEDSNPIFTDCVFADNDATKGGGVNNSRFSRPVFTRCSFSGNTSREGGGLRMVESRGAEFTDCTITGNEGIMTGGAFTLLNTNDTLTFTNCVISGNSANIGGGIYAMNSAAMRMINTRVCGNSSQGTVSESTQISDNASFTKDSTMCVSAYCCDCGDASFPGDLDCNGVYDAVDVRLAMEEFGITECGTPVAGDFDGDDDLDADDFVAIRDALGFCAADINGDGQVDGADFAYVLGFWGACSAP